MCHSALNTLFALRYLIVSVTVCHFKVFAKSHPGYVPYFAQNLPGIGTLSPTNMLLSCSYALFL